MVMLKFLMSHEKDHMNLMIFDEDLKICLHHEKKVFYNHRNQHDEHVLFVSNDMNDFLKLYMD